MVTNGGSHTAPPSSDPNVMFTSLSGIVPKEILNLDVTFPSSDVMRASTSGVTVTPGEVLLVGTGVGAGKGRPVGETLGSRDGTGLDSSVGIGEGSRGLWDVVNAGIGARTVPTRVNVPLSFLLRTGVLVSCWPDGRVKLTTTVAAIADVESAENF